jgi:hypothetical protein
MGEYWIFTTRKEEEEEAEAEAEAIQVLEVLYNPRLAQLFLLPVTWYITWLHMTPHFMGRT